MENTVIPNKRYFVISEAAKLCGVKPHVLRYWGEEFSQLKPVRRSGDRRYYQRKDIELICTIKELLYSKGFTIAGAKLQLKKYVKQMLADEDSNVLIKEGENQIKMQEANKDNSCKVVVQIIKELEGLLEIVKTK